MSRQYRSECVDCCLPCLGISCPYYRVKVYTCDICGEENAEYCLDGDDVCKDCAEEILKEHFNELDIFERASILNVGLSEITE